MTRRAFAHASAAAAATLIALTVPLAPFAWAQQQQQPGGSGAGIGAPTPSTPAPAPAGAAVISSGGGTSPAGLRLTRTEKRRLAVIPFEFGNIQHWWGNDDWDIGRDMGDLLKTQLVRDGTYSLLERTMLDQVLNEQAISQAGIADPRSAIQAGRLLGVHAIVVGNVTQFGIDYTSNPGLFGLGRSRNIRAICAVNVRIIDPNTGEVLAAISARGEGAGRGRPTGGKTGQGGINMSKCTYENTYMAEAVNRCVQQIVAELVAAEPRVASARPQIRGKVADYDASGTVVFNLGVDKGVRAGDQIAVERVVRQVRDPDTGTVIRDVTQRIGKVTILNADASASSGRFEPSGAAGEVPRVGDIAVRL